MLNINPFVNFKNNLSQLRPNNNFNSNSINKYPNLSPLAHDTISFGSSLRLNDTLMNAFDNIGTCEEVYNNSTAAENQLKRILKDATSGLMQTDNNPDGIIKEVKTRVKSPESIREKVASELEKRITSDVPTAFNPKSEKDIKAVCRDIIGGRIILNQSDKQSTKKVLDALARQVKSGRLKVSEVKYTAPKNLKKSLQYYTESELINFTSVVNAHKKPDAPDADLHIKTSDSGYMALHLIVDLSNPEYKDKNNNYMGEIQIVGYDINQLKDVEDFCYKLKSNKGIKRGNPAYTPFSEYFSSFFKDKKNYPNLENAFLTYTQRAYQYQRQRPATQGKENKKYYRLPTIEQVGLKGQIPSGLDFNNLQKIKYHCDRISELTKNETALSNKTSNAGV